MGLHAWYPWPFLVDPETREHQRNQNPCAILDAVVAGLSVGLVSKHVDDFGTQAAAGEVPLDVIQKVLGHGLATERIRLPPGLLGKFLRRTRQGEGPVRIRPDADQADQAKSKHQADNPCAPPHLPAPVECIRIMTVSSEARTGPQATTVRVAALCVARSDPARA